MAGFRAVGLWEAGHVPSVAGNILEIPFHDDFAFETAMNDESLNPLGPLLTYELYYFYKGHLEIQTMPVSYVYKVHCYVIFLDQQTQKAACSCFMSLTKVSLINHNGCSYVIQESPDPPSPHLPRYSRKS